MWPCLVSTAETCWSFWHIYQGNMNSVMLKQFLSSPYRDIVYWAHLCTLHGRLIGIALCYVLPVRLCEHITSSVNTEDKDMFWCGMAHVYQKKMCLHLFHARKCPVLSVPVACRTSRLPANVLFSFTPCHTASISTYSDQDLGKQSFFYPLTYNNSFFRFV